MRPGQGQRRGGRRGGDNRHNGGQHRSSNHQPQQGGQRSATSLRNQIFDSNGPDMRVRGNAFQVHEKYQALAKDALSSGDRVLAENYLQHAEHYHRIIEAINEATAAEQRARQASWESQPQPQQSQQGGGAYYEGQPTGQPQGQSQGQPPQGDYSPDAQHGEAGSYAQDGQNQHGQQHQGQQGEQQGQGNPYPPRRRDQQRDFQPRRDRDNRNDRSENRGENRGEGRDRNNRDRDGRNDSRGEGRNENRGEGRGDNRDQQRDNYGNRHDQNQQPYPQAHQQQGGNQTPDPLFDGVDEDGMDSPDTQAAMGGRR